MAIEIDGTAAGRALDKMRGGRSLIIFLDYDGTLTPIVERPELAVLSEDMRETVRALAECLPVYVISGRDLDDVKQLVQIDGIHYVGSHGFDLVGDLPGVDKAGLEATMPVLARARDELEAAIGAIPGVLVENKKRSFALHYRLVDEARLPEIFSAADTAFERHPQLQRKEGKKVIEFLPDFPWDKGRCVLALLAHVSAELGLKDPFPVYLGDDITDEDAFRAMKNRGAGILVADNDRDTAADYRLHDPDAVGDLFRYMLAHHD